ncbi:MAG: hypothetical protein ACTSSG_12760 [Candidatus Heimdallarchaeaceae archaeon]
MSEKIPYLKFRVKKSKRADFLDSLAIIKQHKHEEDENFYYVYFAQADKEVKQLFKNVCRLKATKIWICGKEIYRDEVSYETLEKTIFCPYKETCEGFCKHSIGLEMGRKISWDDPFYNEKVAKQASLEALLNWIKKNEKFTSIDYYEEDTVREMQEFSILELNKDKKLFTINKESLLEYINRKFSFELEYCPLIKREQFLNLVTEFPQEIKIEEKLLDYFLEKERRYIGITNRITTQREEEEEELTGEYEEKIIELLGKEIEKRLRKVLTEFFEKK